MRIHFIGICGTAMATVAALLKRQGHDVTGSDQNVYPPMSDFLVAQGITLLQGYRPEHISSDLDLVIVGNAISRGNPELEEVLDRKIRYCSLPEAVRDHFLWGARSVVITGTHGKTTTTALTGWLLTDGGADPSVLIGGIAENFDGSFRVGGGREFVIEGDEYDSAFFDKTAKFLKYLPEIAVINNIEFDHADIYPDLEAIVSAFRKAVEEVAPGDTIVANGDDANVARLRSYAAAQWITFGFDPMCDAYAVDVVEGSVADLPGAAFAATMKAPEFLAEAAKLNFEVNPVLGEAMQQTVAKILATPKAVAERAKPLLQ